MTEAIQLDFFEPLDENFFLRKLVIEEKETNRKTCKKLFALNADLKLEIMILRNDIEWLKQELTKQQEIA